MRISTISLFVSVCSAATIAKTVPAQDVPAAASVAMPAADSSAVPIANATLPVQAVVPAPQASTLQPVNPVQAPQGSALAPAPANSVPAQQISQAAPAQAATSLPAQIQGGGVVPAVQGTTGPVYQNSMIPNGGQGGAVPNGGASIAPAPAQASAAAPQLNPVPQADPTTLVITVPATAATVQASIAVTGIPQANPKVMPTPKGVPSPQASTVPQSQPKPNSNSNPSPNGSNSGSGSGTSSGSNSNPNSNSNPKPNSNSNPKPNSNQQPKPNSGASPDSDPKTVIANQPSVVSCTPQKQQQQQQQQPGTSSKQIIGVNISITPDPMPQLQSFVFWSNAPMDGSGEDDVMMKVMGAVQSSGGQIKSNLSITSTSFRGITGTAPSKVLDLVEDYGKLTDYQVERDCAATIGPISIGSSAKILGSEKWTASKSRRRSRRA